MVVRVLPTPERDRRRVEVRELMSRPELLVVDPMAPFHLPILLGPPRADVAMPNPGGLDGKGEGKGELLAPVAVQSADPDGEGAADLGEKRRAGLLAEPRIEAENAQPRAIVDGGVLISPAAGNPDELDIDLDARVSARRETNLTSPVPMLYRKMSLASFRSPTTISDPAAAKATHCPSTLIAGFPAISRWQPAPFVLMLTSRVVCRARSRK